MQKPEQYEGTVPTLELLTRGYDVEGVPGEFADVAERYASYVREATPLLNRWETLSQVERDELAYRAFFPPTAEAELNLREISEALAGMTLSDLSAYHVAMSNSADQPQDIFVLSALLQALEAAELIDDILFNTSGDLIAVPAYWRALIRSVQEGRVVCWRLATDLHLLFTRRSKSEHYTDEMRHNEQVEDYALFDLLEQVTDEQLDRYLVLLAQCLRGHREELRDALLDVLRDFDATVGSFYEHSYGLARRFIETGVQRQRFRQLAELLRERGEKIHELGVAWYETQYPARRRQEMEAAATRLRRLFDGLAALLLRSYELPFAQEVQMIPGGALTQEPRQRFEQTLSSWQRP